MTTTTDDEPVWAERGLGAEFAETITNILDAGLPEYDAGFHGYCGRLLKRDELDRYVRFHEDLLRLAGIDPRGQAVLDAGCGYGLTLVLLGFLGARRLCGVVIEGRMAVTARAYTHLLPREIQNRLEIVVGDVRQTPYPDDSLDVILSIEAISHFHTVDPFISEAHRVLKPGGKLVISDGNNGLNWLKRRSRRAYWEAFEFGPKGRVIEGHRVGFPYGPYVDRREQIIAEHFPDLSASDVSVLASRTSGMTRVEILDACRVYRKTGTLPTSVYRHGQAPADPDLGAMERLFNPYELGRQLSAYGFETRVHGHWGGANGIRATRLANQALDAIARISMPTARGFRIVAQKR